jgi:hypothetical protein
VQRRWINIFNEAARSLLAQRQTALPVLEAEPCPDHGAGGVRILAGDFIVDHVPFGEISPEERAATLCARLCPRPG